MNTLTIEELEAVFREKVVDRWIPEGRVGNHGSAGNLLEDLLGVEENNLRVPDWGIYELKTHKKERGSLVTLLHSEPEPRACVPKLIQALGWRHREAGQRHPETELAFHSTTSACKPSVRGFVISHDHEHIEFRFEPSAVALDKADQSDAYKTYGEWLIDVENRQPHYSEILPVRWPIEKLVAKFVEKLDNTLLAIYSKKIDKEGNILIRFDTVVLMSGFRPDSIAELFKDDVLKVDFDARTGHNHGTKFRVDSKHLDRLFERYEVII